MSQLHASPDRLPDLDAPKRDQRHAVEDLQHDLSPATVDAGAFQPGIAQRTWMQLDAPARWRGIIARQHTHGNASTTRHIQSFDLQRQAAAPTAATLPDVDELTARLARCIGIWETNRGRDNPNPRESALDTVAGVHASMATIEQATMPYAIDALKRHASLRNRANPPLTMQELNAADARCRAVVTLLSAVSRAAAAGTEPAAFIQQNGDAIAATGLGNDDVQTMFDAVGLRATIDAARAQVASKRQTLDQATDSIPESERLGLGRGSIKAYIRQSRNWGEHRAGWQRKAVNAMPDNVGARIEAVSVADNGTALAVPVIRGRVAAQLARRPQPSEQEIVMTVAQQNNPNEQNYGQHVWETYQRLY